MLSDRRLFLLTLGSASLAASLAACASGPQRVERPMNGDYPGIPFADWTDQEPEYLLYPGDEIEVATPTASELTRTVRIGPDGRIALPLIGSVMAADRTLPQLQQVVSAAYAPQLVRPTVEVTLRASGTSDGTSLIGFRFPEGALIRFRVRSWRAEPFTAWAAWRTRGRSRSRVCSLV